MIVDITGWMGRLIFGMLMFCCKCNSFIFSFDIFFFIVGVILFLFLLKKKRKNYKFIDIIKKEVLKLYFYFLKKKVG